MALVRTRVRVVLQFPEMTTSRVSVLRVSSAYLLPLRDRQVAMAQAPFNLLLLPWIPKGVRFCVLLMNGVTFP